MKIVIENPRNGEGDQIIIRCQNIDSDILAFLNDKSSQISTLTAYKDSEIYLVHPSDIYYIDTVDKKTFFYLKTEVYESKQKLYELERLLPSCSFFRATKSTIVNLNKIKSIAPALSRRLMVTLENGERIFIAQRLVQNLKLRLGV